MTLQELLSDLTDIDADAAGAVRDAVLDDLNIDHVWDVVDQDVELAQDETGDWHLVTIARESDPDDRVSIYLVNTSIQLYIEETDEWTRTTQDTDEIESTLQDRV